MLEKTAKNAIECRLCHHHCRLGIGQIGRCGVRVGDVKEVRSLVYGKLVAENIDPVEKKPLFHVLPGELTYSIATPGCNFTCNHCQNSSISQVVGGLPNWLNRGRIVTDCTPEDVVSRAVSSRCTSMSYTYVEPTVFLEFALDCAVLAKERGLGNLFVSNGYMSQESLEQMAPLVTAINIDLKAWSDDFYRKVCGASLAPVVENIRKCVGLGVWVEVTTLLIPGVNDSVEELKEIAGFLAGLDRNIPWHVTAFHPAHKMASVVPTPESTIDLALRVGHAAGLRYVYSGNISGAKGTSTLCPGCGTTLITRNHFTLSSNHVGNGNCPTCKATIAGVWR
ncbi:AmmeMemoRadiSam system radical SAM enzyme [Desulforhopalus sp. 52FAK]